MDVVIERVGAEGEEKGPRLREVITKEDPKEGRKESLGFGP